MFPQADETVPDGTDAPGPKRYPDPPARSEVLRESLVSVFLALLGLLIAGILAVLIFVPHAMRR